MRFKIDRARHIVGRKFTVFALFCFVFGAISKYKPPPGGGLYSEVRFNGGFFGVTSLGGLYLEELIRGAYFRNFTVYCQEFRFINKQMVALGKPD